MAREAEKLGPKMGEQSWELAGQSWAKLSSEVSKLSKGIAIKTVIRGVKGQSSQRAKQSKLAKQSSNAVKAGKGQR